MIKRFTLTLIFYLAAATFFSTAQAHDSLLIVRGNGQYPPYEMLNSDNKLEGVHIELVKQVAAKLNIHVTFKSLPWNRAIHFMEQGKADAITYIGKTPKRELFAYFCEGNHLSETRNGFFTFKNRFESIDYQGNFSSLAGLRIGSIQGYSYGQEFDNNQLIIKDSGAQSLNTLVKKLANKRFDLAIGNVDSVRFTLKQESLDSIIGLFAGIPGSIKQYIAFSKQRNHKALAERFALEMIKFKKTPAYDEILARYGLQ